MIEVFFPSGSQFKQISRWLSDRFGGGYFIRRSAPSSRKQRAMIWVTTKGQQ
jgi:hypothetical protein